MMGKMPYFQFYPLDWLRDTAKLSPAAQGYWIRLLCLAWNEPERGIYERTEIAACYELGTDPIGLKDLLHELAGVANVRFRKDIVRIESRRMIREETTRKKNAKYQDHFRNKDERKGNVSLSKEDVMGKKLEVRSQKLEVRSQQNSASPPNGPPKGAFDLLWNRYPKRKGRKAALRHFNNSVRTLQDWLDVQNALDNYIAEIRRDHIDPQFVKHGSTWMNNWHDDVSYHGVEMPKPPPAPPRPVEVPPPELSEEDLQEIHAQKIAQLGNCRETGCKFCKKNAKTGAPA